MATKQKLDWKGPFCAIVTPFDARGEIDDKAFQDVVDFQAKSGMPGIVICGGAGEYWNLSTAERNRLSRLAVEAARGRLKVIAGITSPRLAEVLDLAEGAKKAGCDGVMLEPPSYYFRPSRNEIVNYYREVDQVGIPVVVYNIPGYSGVNLTPDVLGQLAELPTVSALKESSQNYGQVVQCIKAVGDRLVIFVGYSVLYGVGVLAMGADGFISTEPNFVPQMTLELYRLCAKGDLAAARDLQMRMADLYQAVFGLPASYQAVLKGAMNLLGLPGGLPRNPLAPLTEKETADLRATLQRLGLAVRA